MELGATAHRLFPGAKVRSGLASAKEWRTVAAVAPASVGLPNVAAVAVLAGSRTKGGMETDRCTRRFDLLRTGRELWMNGLALLRGMAAQTPSCHAQALGVAVGILMSLCATDLPSSASTVASLCCSGTCKCRKVQNSAGASE